MDVVLAVILVLAGIAVLAAFVRLARREAFFRRLPTSADPVDRASGQLDAQAAAHAAQIMRGGGTSL